MHQCRAGIVITTRNREGDLFEVLTRLESQAKWSRYPVWIHDDASDAVSDSYFGRLQQRVFHVVRNAERAGLIVNRTASGFAVPFDYILSLDDDSCFVDPDGPDRAVEYMNQNPHVAALSFPLVEGFDCPPVEDSRTYPCVAFAGCAHLIRKEVFVKLGGYYNDFIHQGEEDELCYRIWNAGYEVHAFPSCRVYHWASAVARDWRRMGYYGPRNRMWINMLHLPSHRVPFEVLRSFAGAVKLSFKTGLLGVHLRGLAAGLYHGLRTWKDRSGLSRRLYRRLQSLPYSAK